jgi:histidine triad (HIT) family protein
MASYFTRLLDGTEPGHLLWRDEAVGVALAPKPLREGHVIVFTVDEVDAWYDVRTPLNARLFETAQRVASVVASSFPCVKVGLAAVGIETRHAHLHLVPIDTGADLDFSRSEPNPAPDRLLAVAARLRPLVVESLGPGR